MDSMVAVSFKPADPANTVKDADKLERFCCCFCVQKLIGGERRLSLKSAINNNNNADNL